MGKTTRERKIISGDVYNCPRRGEVEVRSFDMNRASSIIVDSYQVMITTKLSRGRKRIQHFSIPVTDPLWCDSNFSHNRQLKLGNEKYYASIQVSLRGVKEVSRMAMVRRADHNDYVYELENFSLFGISMFPQRHIVLFFETKERYKKFYKWFWSGSASRSGMKTRYYDNSIRGRLEDQVESLLYHLNEKNHNFVSIDIDKELEYHTQISTDFTLKPEDLTAIRNLRKMATRYKKSKFKDVSTANIVLLLKEANELLDFKIIDDEYSRLKEQTELTHKGSRKKKAAMEEFEEEWSGRSWCSCKEGYMTCGIHSYIRNNRQLMDTLLDIQKKKSA